MVTETFANKHEIKNPSPHYNCLHKSSVQYCAKDSSFAILVLYIKYITIIYLCAYMYV